jgi:hypothetical protein
MARRSTIPSARIEESLLINRFAAMLALSLLLACGPTLVLPGGALDGTSAMPPPDWGWTDDISTIQLETRPEDPYSVNIWAVGIEQKLYIHAGANRSTWVENMEDNSSVRVRIDEKIYELVASRVYDQAEFDAFAIAYEDKYGSLPRNENIVDVYLFYLQAP